MKTIVYTLQIAADPRLRTKAEVVDALNTILGEHADTVLDWRYVGEVVETELHADSTEDYEEGSAFPEGGDIPPAVVETLREAFAHLTRPPAPPED